MPKTIKRRPHFDPGSGNVFADLGLPDANRKDAKVRLAVVINRLLDSRRLTPVAAAKMLGISQLKVSALRNYKLDGFLVERLMGYLISLGSDIEIRVRATSSRARSPGRITVQTA